jgi:SAM-dependent methyltransferase
MNKVLHHYNSDHLPISAEEIVPLIMNKLNPVSVVDIGCGLAQWLKVFQNNGVNDVLGIDGNHVPTDKIYVDKSNFLVYNLENGFDFEHNKIFDLAVSLEVAEHISEQYSDGLVHMITSLSNRILFSAAIPNQTGENHLNEQPHVYWKYKFQQKGYEMLDIIRPLIWNNKKINWWYRQNIFLLVKKNDILFDESFVYDERQVIHPELLNMYVNMFNHNSNSKRNTKLTLKDKIKLLIK